MNLTLEDVQAAVKRRFDETIGDTTPTEAWTRIMLSFAKDEVCFIVRRPAGTLIFFFAPDKSLEYALEQAGLL